MLIINNQKQKQAVMQNSNRPASYTKLSYIQKVSRINRKLRLGDITKAAAATGFSTTHVSDVAAGKYFNTEIVNSFEPLYTITIPFSELERIKEFEEQVFNNMKQYGAHHYQMFEVMMEQKHQEKRLRDKYSAVKKAYEHYSLMLKLAESGEL